MSDTPGTPTSSDDARRATLRWGARTHVGQVRDANQDAVLADGPVFVVADGMGGHRGGEVASATAVRTMADAERPLDVSTLVTLVARANVAIRAKADDPDLDGMGTTLCAIALLDQPGPPTLGIVNVGDSRVYRLADDRLDQVSDDHSLVAALMRDGRITADEAVIHPQRNIVTRALGIEPEVLVDHWEVPAIRGHRYLLCSDGLTGEVHDADIAETLRSVADPDAAAARLIELANAHGGRDNITAIVLDVIDGPEGPADPAPPAATASTNSPTLDGGPTATAQSTTAALDVGDAVAHRDEHDNGARHRGDGPGRAPDDSDAVDPPVPAVPEPDQPVMPRGPADGPARKRLVRRLVLGVGALLLAAVLVVGFAARQARSGYFVGFDAPDTAGDTPQVVIYKGTPGGFLWFDPTLEARTTVLASALTDALILNVEGNPEFDDLEAARAYVTTLEAQLDDQIEADR